MTSPATVPCGTCGQPTTFAATKRCNACWEVEARLGDYLRRGGARAHAFVASKVLTTMPRREAVDIVFDGPPEHKAARFVEVETLDGKSVRVGEWKDRGNGQWALRIPGVDLPKRSA